MASILGLSGAQNTALSGAQLGDIIFIREQPPVVDDDPEEEEEGSEDDGNEGDSEDREDSDDDGSEDGGQDDEEASSTGDGDESDVESDSDDMDVDDENAPQPGRVYAISQVVLDPKGTKIGLQLSPLTYSSTLGQEDDPHSFQIYAKDVVTCHPVVPSQPGTVCSTPLGSANSPQSGCASAVCITQVVTNENFVLQVNPDGEMIRMLDPTFGPKNARGFCISGCNDGFLANHDMLRNMVKDYDPPALSLAQNGHDLATLMPAVCPVCCGADKLVEQQTLQSYLLAGMAVDLGLIVEFLGSLNPVRRAQGYSFYQFDERQWAMLFDDMLSDDEDGADSDGGWQQASAAIMDPNSTPVTTNPASATTIAALPRKLKKDTILSPGEGCMVCKDILEEEDVLIELDCGHVDHHEACLTQWLEYNSNCPSCRRHVSEVVQEQPGGEETEMDVAHEGVPEMDAGEVVA